MNLHGGPTSIFARRGFTLIEIMVCVGIMAVILTISVPSIYQQLKRDSMRQVIADLTEACSQARARAILNGVSTEVRIRPGDRTISVVEAGGARGPSFGAPDVALEEAPARGGGASIFSATITDHVIIEFIGVNLIPDLHLADEVSATFYSNGTCDELVVLLRSDVGEVRKLTTDVVTGIADFEVIK
jgi:prepilin-type N-terminal cleavage/methylation domain-containing protein